MAKMYLRCGSSSVLTFLNLYFGCAGACKLSTAGEEHHMDPHVRAVICGDLVLHRCCTMRSDPTAGFSGGIQFNSFLARRCPVRLGDALFVSELNRAAQCDGGNATFARECYFTDHIFPGFTSCLDIREGRTSNPLCCMPLAGWCLRRRTIAVLPTPEELQLQT